MQARRPALSSFLLTVAEGFSSMRNTILLCIFLSFCSVCFAGVNPVIPTVIVSPEKFPSNTLTSGSESVITRQDIVLSGANSLSQALQDLGVQLQDTIGNGGTVALSMRGFGGNAVSNTLLLVNGMPITNPDMMPPDLNAIPLQDIQFVEVIAGSESVLYGDQAVGGVVNIITREMNKEKFAVSCSGGSYNSHNCGITANNSIHNLIMGINAFTSHSDNYREQNNYDQNHLSGHFAYPYATDSRLLFDYQLGNERMQYPGALSSEQVGQNRRQATNDTDFFWDWSGLYHLHDEQQLGANWQLMTDIMRREMHGNGVLTSPFNQSRLTYFIKPQLKGLIGKTQLISGIDVANDHYHLTSVFGAEDDSQQKYGLFAVVNHPITDHLTFSVGARGAQQNNQLLSLQNSNMINRAFAATVGINYLINQHLKVYLRRAGSFRFPKADENAAAGSGVTALRTQRGAAYETGVSWDCLRTLTKLNIYQLNLRDEIAFDPTQTPQQPFGSNVNLAPTIRRGFSVSEKYQATSKLALNGQYNYVNARFQSGIYSGNRIPSVAENILHAGADYKVNDQWNVYGEALYTGNQFAANDFANVTRIVGGYTVYNFNLRYHIKHFSAAFHVNNLLNKYYNFYTVLQSNAEFYYPAPGRNLLLTLKYVFD